MNKLKILIAILLFGLTTGCEEYLDKSPELGLTEEEVFSAFESARGFLDEGYNVLYDFHAWDAQDLRNSHISSLSDEMASVTLMDPPFSIVPLNNGEWLNKPNFPEVGWNTSDNAAKSSVIGAAFATLRRVNMVIKNAETIDNITTEELNGLLGQAYFLRGWYYFQIIQRWGGMPIFDKVFSPTDDMDLPRLTYQESSEWLISDMDKAIELLPHKWPDEQYGRATKGSAYGLKAMAALYAASPLMKNDLQTIQNTGYDQEWAERAAQYASEAIKYVQNASLGHDYRLMPKEEYANIFYQEEFGSDESLWFKLDGHRRETRDFTTQYLPRRIGAMGGTGASAVNFSNPTQNVVDMYETLDGYPISHPASNYDPAHPFVNRDPRLTNNIIIPGEAFGLDKGNKPMYWELYVGGLDYQQLLDAPVSASRMASGYAVKKYIWPEANGITKEYRKNDLNTIYIRVSQLYLDYAEAMNEAYGPNADPEGYGMTAVQAINVIRNRVGMPNVLAEFTGSKEAFRDRIRNERAVELMFENHRWHDLRRWMIAEEVLARPITGLRAIPPANHKKVADKSSLNFTYEVVPLTPETRVFTIRQYWYPVAQDHVENLYNFNQNPGW